MAISAEMDAEYRRTGVHVDPSEETVEETVVTEMKMPVMKSADYADHRVLVEWYPVEHADGYSVWRMSDKHTWVKIGRIYGTECTYVDYDLVAHTRYAYTVKSIATVAGSKVISQKDPLGVDVYVPEGNIPDVPKLSKRLDAEGRECIAWTKVENIAAYRIMRREEGGEWALLTQVEPSAPRMFRDEEAQPGTAYYYSVSAYRVFDSHVVSSDFDEEGIALKA